MSEVGRGGPAHPPAGGGVGPGWPTAAPAARPLGSGDPAEVGPYRLEAVLGAGGMGRVYLGRTPAGSEVAVKLVHREFAGDRAFRRRFELEVAAARRVQGLYTVPVVDADLRAEEPWLATAYVPGPSLQDAVEEEGPLQVDAALGLIARVAEALQSIHAAGVIHRDLKPSNILLTGEGPKVIDFGIARAADVTSVTGTGMRAGTPAYMAPEYIKGQELTGAVDIFALGLIAHFAVTGRLAFGGGSAHSVTYRILEQDPDLHDCPEPLRTIAARCLHKDPHQRPTPTDVIHHCRTTPTPERTVVDVHSAPTQPAHPAVPGAPGSPDVVGAPAPPPARQDPAQGTPRQQPGSSQPAPHAPDQFSPNPYAPVQGWAGGRVSWIVIGSVLLVTALIAFFVPSHGGGEGSAPRLKPTTTLTSSDAVDEVAFSPDGKTLAAGVQAGKVRLWDVAGRKQRATLNQRNERGEEQALGISCLAFSPDGKRLAAVAADRTMGLWDLAARRQIATFTVSTSDPVRDVAFSPNGKVVATGGEDGKVRLWDARSREDRDLATLDHGQPVWDVAFSPDGRRVASAGYEPDGRTVRTGRLWNVADHKAGASFHHPESITRVAFSQDGQTLFTVGTEDKVRQWDAGSGREKDPLVDGGFISSSDDVESSPDGKTLATAHFSDVRLWDQEDGTPLAVLTGFEDGDQKVAFSPGGRLVATAAGDGKIRMWKVPKDG
ncbi:protein kinase [Streptomyces bathyalis]|uniref:Protein kinase n=1 Tax=Streptomyces bathyalis TaxID=2710756 RepID=A0A7T1WR78_9ACTN|nr:protein kinase [Streptomyces bathyalis]